MLGGPETTAFGAATLGDLAYDVARLRLCDAAAVEAFDFAQRADLSDLTRLARWATDIRGKPALAQAGDINRLQGYVFERLAALSLREQGAEVSFPATANHPGADLLVNGQWVQAKCGLSPALVERHFARYPDVPVIVNEDLAAVFEGDPRVVAVAGVTRALTRDATERALDDAAEVLDLELVHIVPVIGAARVSLAWLRGDTDLVGAGRALAVDSAGRFAGALLGKAVAAGVVATGVLTGWMAVLAPLAASAVGFRAGRGLTGPLKELLFCRAETAALREATRGFCRDVAARIAANVETAARQAELFRRARMNASPEWRVALDDWLRRLQQEQDFRDLTRRRLLEGATDSLRLAPRGGPLAAAEAALRLAGTAGILPTDVAGSLARLRVAGDAFSRGMQRHLLSPS
jgi:hypothetical protein